MRRPAKLSFMFIGLLSSAALPTLAQTPASNSNGGLEDIVVTAQHRSENLQEVPLSVAAVSGDKLTAIQSGATDIRGLSARIPSLLIESSFGRTFPRFYIRGLGNTDFDLNASQPVSLVYDDVVLENPILKGFPVFDLERVEVLRGPQGTLFGRNTPAGIVKFDTVKPSQEPGGYARASYGTLGTATFEGAAGGGLTDKVAVRASVSYRHRNNWVDNTLTPQNNDRGGYDDIAARLQFAFQPTDELKMRLVGQVRVLNGSSQIFYANAFKPGTNQLVTASSGVTTLPLVNGNPQSFTVINSDFNRRKISQDGVTSLKLENQNLALDWSYDFGPVTLTSIASYWHGSIKSRGDVDGGFSDQFTSAFSGKPVGPGIIPFTAETEDSIPSLKQFTQEVRISSNGNERLSYQAGFFYFDEKLNIVSTNYATTGNFAPEFGIINAPGAVNIIASQKQKSTAYAVFGSATFKVTDALKVTGGIRYNNDKRDFTASRDFDAFPFDNFSATPLVGTVSTSTKAENITWDASAHYTATDALNLYARVARGYRAPSIQGRLLFPTTSNLADGVTTAKSETITSYETGLKSEFLDGRARFNLGGFYYTVKNLQLTAVGGGVNANRLLNAAKVEGYGFEVDAEAKPTDNLVLTAGVSYNNTKIKDPALTTSACGSNCTLLDPVVVPGSKIVNINGNSLPQSPRWIGNVTARFAIPLGDNGEVYAFTDWAYRSKISFFLYDSKEFNDDSLIEGGLRIGYATSDKKWDASIYVRNITNDVSAVTAVDFNNLTAVVNEPRIFGAEFGVKF
jgi:iron complex outermembrane recepter protein